MSEKHEQLMILSRRSDAKLREALVELDALATARVTTLGGDVARICATVIVDTAADALVEVRRALHGRAWLALGVAVGVGVMLGRASRR